MERQSSPSEPEYSNPEVADGINNPPESQLRAFFVNLGYVVLLLAFLFCAFGLAATYLAPSIPFSWEKRVFGDNLPGTPPAGRDAAKRDELRRLAARLSAAMDLPEGMEVTVHYSSASTVNAFATFGGHIVVFQGLLNLSASEDELAMVLAHEIAHVKHRDAVKGIVRLAGLILLSVGLQGNMDSLMNLGMAGYSRSQENAADLAAVGAVAAVYGHAAGATGFFTMLAEKVEHRDAGGTPSRMRALTASHPDTLQRLRNVRAEAERLGVPLEGELTPLPEVLRENLAKP